MGSKNEEKSFWSTAPGILTGIAAIISAITGLIVALNAAGIITVTSPSAPTPAPTSTLTIIPTLTPTLTPNPTLRTAPAPTPAITTPAPAPELVLSGTESYTAVGKKWVRYGLSIENWVAFPAELFEPAPDLSPCGLNQNASRTWVDVYDANGDTYLNGFCTLSSPKDLTSIWFVMEQGVIPPNEVYVLLKDRRQGNIYRSNVVSPSP